MIGPALLPWVVRGPTFAHPSRDTLMPDNSALGGCTTITYLCKVLRVVVLLQSSHQSIHHPLCLWLWLCLLPGCHPASLFEGANRPTLRSDLAVAWQWLGSGLACPFPQKLGGEMRSLAARARPVALRFKGQTRPWSFNPRDGCLVPNFNPSHISFRHILYAK